MVTGYADKTSYTGFKALQSQITDLAQDLAKIGCCESVVSYLCSRFSVDREYYRDWLCSRDVRDVAELVVLYLSESVRRSVVADVGAISAINS